MGSAIPAITASASETIAPARVPGTGKLPIVLRDCGSGLSFLVSNEGNLPGLGPARYFAKARKSRPVMSAGGGWPRTPNIVGAMSRNEPFGCSRRLWLSLTSTNGTGFVV
jgi:hypothetical protein